MPLFIFTCAFKWNACLISWIKIFQGTLILFYILFPDVLVMMWCDLCQCKFYCFVYVLWASGFCFFSLFNRDANVNRCPIFTLFHFIKTRACRLVLYLNVGLSKQCKWKFLQSFVSDLLGLYLEVKVWLSNPLSVLHIHPHCTFCPFHWVLPSLVIDRRSFPNHSHCTAISDWAAHFRVGKTAQLGSAAGSISALSQEMSTVLTSGMERLCWLTPLLLLPDS